MSCFTVKAEEQSISTGNQNISSVLMSCFTEKQRNKAFLLKIKIFRVFKYHVLR